MMRFFMLSEIKMFLYQSDLEYMVNLLDLPRDIQDKVHRNEITYDKA